MRQALRMRDARGKMREPGPASSSPLPHALSPSLRRTTGTVPSPFQTTTLHSMHAHGASSATEAFEACGATPHCMQACTRARHRAHSCLHASSISTYTPSHLSPTACASCMAWVSSRPSSGLTIAWALSVRGLCVAGAVLPTKGRARDRLPSAASAPEKAALLVAPPRRIHVRAVLVAELLCATFFAIQATLWQPENDPVGTRRGVNRRRGQRGANIIVSRGTRTQSAPRDMLMIVTLSAIEARPTV